MDQNLIDHIYRLQDSAKQLLQDISKLEGLTQKTAEAVVNHGTELSPFIVGLTIFVLACFVGYYVVWRVTPALHSPLMSVTNAISSVIIIGAVLSATPLVTGLGTIWGVLGIFLASINIFGGFMITQRMINMFLQNKKS